MGLITKEIEVLLNGSNMKHYENLNYNIPRIKNKNGRIATPMGTKISIKVSDLSKGSNVKINVECDKCGKELKNIKWVDYIKGVKEDGKYYCQKCASQLYGNENYRKSRLKNSKSFEQWCIENNKQDILDRWDSELNNCLPSEIGYCPSIKYYFKCSRRLHDSELKNIGSFTSGELGAIECKQCNSFAQWGIDNLGEDFLDKYWSYEKNNELDIDPWIISKCAGTPKVWIKCQEKDYHGSYDTTPNNFVNDNRCPFCNSFASGKVHPLDSLGKILENKELLYLWSNKNKDSPYEYAPHSAEDVYWRCLNENHKDYKRKIAVSTILNFRCPDCVRERNESFLQEKVRLYIESFNYTILHENYCTILPKNPKKNGKNYTLPFDNEIKELRLVIEVHGIQHYELCGFHKMLAKHNNTTPEYEFHYQKLKDRYKRIFAKRQGYFYLEIPYFSDDKDETWKRLIDEKINEITNIDKI